MAVMLEVAIISDAASTFASAVVGLGVVFVVLGWVMFAVL